MKHTIDPVLGERITPWYAEPWAWLVFGLPLATVIACLLTILIAARTADGLVVDDYYKRGLEINRVLDREASARDLALAIDRVAVEAAGFSFSLGGNEVFTPPAQLEVRFTHATRATADRTVIAGHLGGGHYRGALDGPAPLAAGPWYVDAGTPEWRLVTRILIGADGRRAGAAAAP